MFAHVQNRFSDSIFDSSNPLMLSAGEWGHSADGAGICKAGATAILARVVSNTESQSSSTDFIPFMVNYRQDYAAAGLASSPTLFEGSDIVQEIVQSRHIDRSLRPLLPADYKHEIYLLCNMLAFDSINPPEVLGINASSLAFALSDIPWNGPVGAVR